MSNVSYTTTDNIRAALGVSDVELLDTLIINASIADQIDVKLSEVFPGAAALAALNAQPPPVPPPTDADVLQWKILKLFCMYYGAIVRSGSGANYPVPEHYGFADNEHAVRERPCRSHGSDAVTRSDLYLGLLNPAYSSDLGLGFGLIGVSRPCKDPVTGRGYYDPTRLIALDSALLLRLGLSV
jgi:hypothetical protein